MTKKKIIDLLKDPNFIADERFVTEIITVLITSFDSFEEGLRVVYRAVKRIDAIRGEIRIGGKKV